MTKYVGDRSGPVRGGEEGGNESALVAYCPRCQSLQNAEIGVSLSSCYDLDDEEDQEVAVLVSCGACKKELFRKVF